ncbi:MAG: Serine/threonine protein kinase, partial [Frankiales bacterium]|nr:Serine/threonine protein kinase [Frankiales bacterium]
MDNPHGPVGAGWLVSVSEPASSPSWAPPGYDLEARAGESAAGEVWRARERATGDVVGLARLDDGVDRAPFEALREELGRLRTPYLLRLRAVVGGVLVLDHATGGSVADLLHRRGRLEAGEVVTVAAPLAAALAEAHAGGMVHGDVSRVSVLLTADGMPLLAGLGVARLARGL